MANVLGFFESTPAQQQRRLIALVVSSILSASKMASQSLCVRCMMGVGFDFVTARECCTHARAVAKAANWGQLYSI